MVWKCRGSEYSLELLHLPPPTLFNSTIINTPFPSSKTSLIPIKFSWINLKVNTSVLWTTAPPLLPLTPSSNHIHSLITRRRKCHDKKNYAFRFKRRLDWDELWDWFHILTQIEFSLLFVWLGLGGKGFLVWISGVGRVKLGGWDNGVYWSGNEYAVFPPWSFDMEMWIFFLFSSKSASDSSLPHFTTHYLTLRQEEKIPR